MSRISRHSQAADNIADLLTCPICLDPFNDGERQPKLLPCHHSFCQHCLSLIANNRPTIECPQCRNETQLPSLGGVSSLQTNFYVTHMQDLIGDHSKLKVKGCRKHGNQDLTYFCRTCEIAICQDCTYSDHREPLGHMYVAMAIALQEQKRLLEIEISDAQESIIKNKTRVKHLETEIGNLFAAKDKSLADIDSTFDRYIEALNLKRQRLHEQLRNMYRLRREKLSSEIENIKMDESSLMGLVDQCEDALQDGGISDILAYKSKMVSKNCELRQKEVVVDPGNNFIKFDPEDGQLEFLNAVQDVGCLHSKKPLPCMVKFSSQRAIAGLFTTMSFHVSSLAGEQICNYPIDVELQDVFDDIIPSLVQHRNEGRYEVTFRPQVSGLHRIKIRFLESAILSELSLNVQSNNATMCLGDRGSLEGQMEFPRAVTVDNHNNIYVADTGNNRIQKFDKMGKFLFDFPLSAEEEDVSTCGIAVDNSRNMLICPEVILYNADITQANALLMYSNEGHLKQRLVYRDVMRRALSVAVNSAGSIIIADYELNAIFVFDKHGRLVRKFGESGSRAGMFNHPTFVGIGEDDCIIVSDGDNHRIQVFDKNGKFLYMFGSKGNGKGQFNMPFGVAADNHGNILVVDGSNRRIQIFKVGGDFVGCIESLNDKMNAPRGIGLTSDGYVVVADRDNHCVKKFKYLLCTSI